MNRDWDELKKSSNGIPTWDSVIPYILEVLKDGEEATNKVIRERLFDFLRIPDTILSRKYPENPDMQGVLSNRVSFALSDLYKADAVKRPRRGVYKITETGLSLLNQYGDKLTNKILENMPEYRNYLKELQLRNQRTQGITENAGVDTVSVAIEDNMELDIEGIINTKNNEVAIELLDKIQDNDPYFFERLVVNLLDKMGYSGENGEAKVTRQSNDGGIDGIINQDPLGTSTVYLQAKRYKEDNIIGRSSVQSFYGALAGINADRGVFITTSRFSNNAREFAKNQGIVLINGIQLTELMLRYEVGVEKANEYTIYRIDNDYFELE